MTDDQRRMLTGYIGEKWGEEYYDPENRIYRSDYNRTFATWSDLGAVKEAIVKKGEWIAFHCFCRQMWLDKTASFRIDLIPDSYSEYTLWLFRPTDEAGEPHFACLVCEWKGWK